MLDGDARLLMLHAPEGDEEEPAALVAALWVFLAAHVVLVVAEEGADAEWVRRLRLLQELRRAVGGPKGAAAALVVAGAGPGEVAGLLGEQRGAGEGGKRLFRLVEGWTETGLAGLRRFAGTGPWQPPKMSSKRDLAEMARQLIAGGGGGGGEERKDRGGGGVGGVLGGGAMSGSGKKETAFFRRVVAACNCGQRQVVLRDPSEAATGPCCAESAVALSSGGGGGGGAQWALSSGGAAGAATEMVATRGFSFAVEYECGAGHRFLLSENMAKVVMRLQQLERLLSSDTPLFTKCLSCKQEASDAPPAQLVRLYLLAHPHHVLLVDPVVRFKPKSPPATMPFVARLPCGPIVVAGGNTSMFFVCRASISTQTAAAPWCKRTLTRPMQPCWLRDGPP